MPPTSSVYDFIGTEAAPVAAWHRDPCASNIQATNVNRPAVPIIGASAFSVAEGKQIRAELCEFCTALRRLGRSSAAYANLNEQKTDWEVELGVVIGTPAKYVTEQDALSHVAGYCVVNDLSERAFQMEGTGQWVKGKSADTFGPIGPWLVTADEVPDPQALSLWLEIDGQRFQNGTTSTMVFTVAKLVSYVSNYMSLQPGDIISTGTPPGVGLGQKPPRYLQPGETMTLGVEGLGVQTQRVVAYAG